MAPESPKRIVLVVMGVSGSGKSTIAASVAATLGAHFVEGDALHSQASVERMRAGTPLTDADRWPWLDRIGACLADVDRWPRGVVAACSALKRSYRDRIRVAAPGVGFAFLDGPASIIEERMATRLGHYMPASLLASQLQTLERPAADERDVLVVAIDRPASDIAAIVARGAAAAH
jgi:gluconokinase